MQVVEIDQQRREPVENCYATQTETVLHGMLIADNSGRRNTERGGRTRASVYNRGNSKAQ